MTFDNDWAVITFLFLAWLKLFEFQSRHSLRLEIRLIPSVAWFGFWQKSSFHSNHTSPNTFKILKGTILSHYLHRYFNGKLHFCYSNPILCHQFYLMVPMQSYILLLPNDSHFTMIMQVTSEYSVLWGALGFQTSLHIPEELSGGKFESLM